MKFIAGLKVYVRYDAGIYQPYVERLTVEKYENGLLYFKEKPPYEAIECRTALFYGSGESLAGSTLVTVKKWHLALAAVSQKLRRLLPPIHLYNKKTSLHRTGKYAHFKTNNG